MNNALAQSPMPHKQQPDAPTSTPYNTRDAALKGAALAFGKPQVKPKPQVTTHTGNKGALAAARRSSTPQPQQLQPQPTGNSTTSTVSQTSHLGLPIAQPGRARSPSMIAAGLAAARHTPNPERPDNRRKSTMDTPNNAPNESLPGPGAVSDIRAKFNGSGTIKPSADAKEASVRATRPPSHASDHPDASSIAPTTSLVKMFEQNKPAAAPAAAAAAAAAPAPVRNPKPAPFLTSQGGPPAIVSPKPTRNITVPFASPDQPKPDATKLRPVSAGNISATKPKPAPKPAKLSTSPNVSPRMPSKPSFSVAPREIPTPSNKEDSDDEAAYMSAPETQAASRAKPTVPPPRRTAKKTTDSDQPTPSNSGAPAPTRPTPAARLRRHSSATADTAPPAASRQLLPPPPISSAYKRESMKKLERHLTGDSLANAMVGAALAGSRAPTPSKSPLPALPPPRRSGANTLNAHHHHHGAHLFHSRTPSPTKKPPGKLMPTLRKEASSTGSDSDDGINKHKRPRHLRPKHPNKHSEGSRARWRDAVTPREKKRYDGVWAANRGELLPATQSDDVAGPVVRDIWGRSRLPGHVLAEVWELVDRRGVGRLSREEFVVGLWLIDQGLKGRKLPVRVGESVWASVRGVVGRVRIR